MDVDGVRVVLFFFLVSAPRTIYWLNRSTSKETSHRRFGALCDVNPKVTSSKLYIRIVM